MADLFKEIIPSILQSGVDVLENEKDYPPFVVNKAISYHYDCIMYANMMNQLPNTPKKQQYQYLLNSIRKYKRPFQKWQKQDKIEDIDAIKEYYKYSDARAKEVISLLSRKQIEDIKAKLDKGGLQTNKK